VLAQAHDGRRPIYGVCFAWDLDGAPQNGLESVGDLFRYRYLEGSKKTVGAQFNGLRAEMVIETSGCAVGSSNHLGCAVGAPGRPPRAADAWLLALAMGLCLRRASRRHSSA
jgi:hypothetical protein